MIFRFILFAVVSYFVWRFLDSIFSNKRPNKPNENGSSGVKFTATPKEKTHIPDSEGDYIDFEDVKK